MTPEQLTSLRKIAEQPCQCGPDVERCPACWAISYDLELDLAILAMLDATNRLVADMRKTRRGRLLVWLCAKTPLGAILAKRWAA